MFCVDISTDYDFLLRGKTIKHLDLFSGYTVSESGEVRNKHGRTIKPQISWNGYVRAELWQLGKGRKYLVHRLVAAAFIPNPNDFPQINHIDGDKLNNHFENLEWSNQSENQLHAYRTGLQSGFRKPVPLSASHKLALCGSRWFGELRIYHAGGLEFSKPEDAAKHFGVSRQTVYNRAASKSFGGWHIEIRREEKQCQRTSQ